MANRTSSRGLNIFQQNGVSHNFFCGGKSGVKYKKLGASRFLAVSTHIFYIFYIVHTKKIINMSRLRENDYFFTWKGPIFSSLAMISYLTRCQYFGVPGIFSKTEQGSSSW